MQPQYYLLTCCKYYQADRDGWAVGGLQASSLAFSSLVIHLVSPPRKALTMKEAAMQPTA